MSKGQSTARLLRLPDVLVRVPLSKATVYRAVRNQQFPAPCKLLNTRSSAWDEREVADWIEARLASRSLGRGVR